MTAKRSNMTADAGTSVASDEYSLTVGPNPLRAVGTCSFPIRSRRGCSLGSRPYRKLGAHSRGEAVQRARAIGLLSRPSAGPEHRSSGPPRAHDGGRGHGIRARRT
jgi:hypothetical protein